MKGLEDETFKALASQLEKIPLSSVGAAKPAVKSPDNLQWALKNTSANMNTMSLMWDHLWLLEAWFKSQCDNYWCLLGTHYQTSYFVFSVNLVVQHRCVVPSPAEKWHRPICSEPILYLAFHSFLSISWLFISKAGNRLNPCLLLCMY